MVFSVFPSEAGGLGPSHLGPSFLGTDPNASDRPPNASVVTYVDHLVTTHMHLVTTTYAAYKTIVNKYGGLTYSYDSYRSRTLGMRRAACVPMRLRPHASMDPELHIHRAQSSLSLADHIPLSLTLSVSTLVFVSRVLAAASFSCVLPRARPSSLSRACSHELAMAGCVTHDQRKLWMRPHTALSRRAPGPF